MFNLLLFSCCQENEAIKWFITCACLFRLKRERISDSGHFPVALVFNFPLNWQQFNEQQFNELGHIDWAPPSSRCCCCCMTINLSWLAVVEPKYRTPQHTSPAIAAEHLLLIHRTDSICMQIAYKSLSRFSATLCCCC